MSSSSDRSVLSQKRLEKLAVKDQQSFKNELKSALQQEPDSLKLTVKVPNDEYELCGNETSPAMTLPTKALHVSPKGPQQAMFASLAATAQMNSDGQPVQSFKSCAFSKNRVTIRRNSCQLNQNMNVKRLQPVETNDEVKSANAQRHKRARLVAEEAEVKCPIVTNENDEPHEKVNKCCRIEIEQMDDDADGERLVESPKALDYLMVKKQVGCTPNQAQLNQLTVAAADEPLGLFAPVKLNVQRQVKNDKDSCASMSDGSSILGDFRKTAVNLTFGLPLNRSKKDDSLLAIEIDSANEAGDEGEFMLAGGNLDIHAQESSTA